MIRAIAAALGSVREALAPSAGIDPERLAVRPATAKDLDAVVALNSLMSEEQSGRYGLAIGGLLRPRSQFKQALADRSSVLLVATVDSTIVGYALAFPMPNGDRVSTWLDALYVDRRFRHSSLPDWLASETVGRLRAAGATELLAQVRAADAGSAQVLARVGLQDRYAVMRRAVSRGSDMPPGVFSARFGKQA